jgi:sirohydrochlorin ferrochelatase
MAPATEFAALIIAHGSPSAPDGPQRAMEELGAAVAALLPEGWAARGATLAAPGAIAGALAELPAAGRLLVYPHFMADGWFTTEELPRRLRAAGAGGFEVLPAFGLDPAVHRLCLRRAEEASLAAHHRPGEAALLVVAHGSPSDPRPAAAARSAADVLGASGLFREVRSGFIEEPPFLADAARLDPPALCLPLFAGQAGHVEADLPAALAQAGFAGAMLPPVGSDPEVPKIIARALKRHAVRRAA